MGGASVVAGNPPFAPFSKGGLGGILAAQAKSPISAITFENRYIIPPTLLSGTTVRHRFKAGSNRPCWNLSFTSALQGFPRGCSFGSWPAGLLSSSASCVFELRPWQLLHAGGLRLLHGAQVDGRQLLAGALDRSAGDLRDRIRDGEVSAPVRVSPGPPLPASPHVRDGSHLR